MTRLLVLLWRLSSIGERLATRYLHDLVSTHEAALKHLPGMVGTTESNRVPNLVACACYSRSLGMGSSMFQTKISTREYASLSTVATQSNGNARSSCAFAARWPSFSNAPALHHRTGKPPCAEISDTSQMLQMENNARGVSHRDMAQLQRDRHYGVRPQNLPTQGAGVNRQSLIENFTFSCSPDVLTARSGRCK